MLTAHLYQFMDSKQALEYILEHVNLNHKKQYWMWRIMEKIDIEAQIFAKVQGRLTRQFGEENKDAQGGWKIKTDNQELFQRAVMEMLNAVVPISKIDKLPLEWFLADDAKAKIPSWVKSKLLWLIEKPEGYDDDEMDIIESSLEESPLEKIMQSANVGEPHKCN